MEKQETDEKDKVTIEIFTLIRRILKTCADEAAEGLKILSINDRVRNYTGYETVPEKRDLKKSKYQHKRPCFQENCESIRSLLVTKYLKEYKYVTVDDVKNEYNDYLDVETNGLLALQTFINNAGFIVKHLPNIDKEIIMEDPLQLFSRQKYLKTIVNYRGQSRNIVYITEIDFNAPNLIIGYKKTILIAMSTDLGVLNISYYDNDTTDKKYLSLKALLKDKVFPLIHPNSVLILEEDPEQSKDTDTLSANSNRKEIIDFLEKNDVPYDSNMHKAILLNLAKKVHIPYKNNDDIVDFIKSFGYDALRRPYGFQSLDIFQPLKETIQKEYLSGNSVPLYNTFCSLVGKCTLHDWKQYEKRLREKEINIYEDDATVDIFVDKILTMSKYSRVTINSERCVFDKK